MVKHAVWGCTVEGTGHLQLLQCRRWVLGLHAIIVFTPPAMYSALNAIVERRVVHSLQHKFAASGTPCKLTSFWHMHASAGCWHSARILYRVNPNVLRSSPPSSSPLTCQGDRHLPGKPSSPPVAVPSSSEIRCDMLICSAISTQAFMPCIGQKLN